MISRRHRSLVNKLHHTDTPLSPGVKMIAWSRAIRWIGWGFGESLIPIFIFAFSASFAEAGLIRSSVDIAALLCLPIIGSWVDRVSARYLILIALITYPLVGLSYFFAGVSGLAIFIVIARVVNGFNWELEDIGIATYYRRMADKTNVATSFGYIDTWSNLAWILAALVGLVLVPFVPIHWLLLGIVPFAIVAYFMVLRAPKDKVRNAEKGTSFLHSYKAAVDEWKTWDRRLWMLSVLTLFSGFVSALMWFFIPIDAFIDGANLPMVVVLSIAGAAPALFGYKLGKLADVKDKYRLIVIGLIIVAIISLGLWWFPGYAFKLAASFVLGIVLELFSVAQDGLITSLGPPETYGQKGSAFESIDTIGSLAAPLILGIGLDTLGFGAISLVVAGVALVLGFMYVPLRQ